MFRICQIKYQKTVFHGQAVKTVAYLRVSTAQQDVRSQRLAILEYARKHDFRIDDFIEPTASGQPSVAYLTEGTRVNKARIERLLVTTVGDQIRFHKSRLGGLSVGERLWVFPGVFRFQGRNSNLKPSILPC